MTGEPILDPIPKAAFRGIKFRSEFDRASFERWCGELQQRRRHLRTIEPYKDIDISASQIRRLVTVTHPWTVLTYPGKIELLAWVIGVSPKCAASWLNKGTMSAAAAQRGAAWLEGKAAEMLALARELREVPPTVRRGFGKKKGPEGP